jgi:hypothetical protein
VNDFVEQCRREWKRLRVPDAVASEMAADLTADLKEAEAEGASAEEVLGSGATDPRSFAAAWAAERAVIPPPRWTARPPGRSLVLATTALTILTAVGAALVIFASPRASEPKSIRVPAIAADRAAAASIAILAVPESTPRLAPAPAAVAVVSPDGRWIARFDRGGHGVLLTETNRSGVEIHHIGSILLIFGIVGLLPSVLLLVWSRGLGVNGPQQLRGSARR